jgi:hypothetical protein
MSYNSAEEFLLPYANDVAGNPITPSKAIKGRNYQCPICVKPVLLRSGAILESIRELWRPNHTMGPFVSDST